MVSQHIQDDLYRTMDVLTPNDQELVVRYAGSLIAPPHGMTLQELSRHAHSMTADEAAAMMRDMDDEFETVEADD